MALGTQFSLDGAHSKLPSEGGNAAILFALARAIKTCADVAELDLICLIWRYTDSDRAPRPSLRLLHLH